MVADDLKTTFEAIEHSVASTRGADDKRVHFLVPWRLNTDVERSLWQQGDDASCGSCPVD